MSCRGTSWLIFIFVAVSLATVYREPLSTKEWSVPESVRDARQGTGEELGALLDAGDGAVVTLEAGGTRLVAHGAVLAARSPVLAAMVRHYSAEAGGRVTVPGVEGPVLRHLVAYLYTLQAPRLPPDMAPQLLVAAHMFGLPALQADCEQQVAAHLSVETAASAAVLAVKYSANHLRDAAINFIKVHSIKVLATKGWADALENQPKEAAEVHHLLVDRLAEICVPASMVAWTTTTTEDETTTTMEAGTTTTTTEAGATAIMEAGTTASTQPHRDHSQPPTTAASPLATCPTSPLDEATVSCLQNLSGKYRDGRLMKAAWKGAVGELRALLAAGADVEARDKSGWTALHWAADEGHVEAASCLLGGGAQVDARDIDQWTPLHKAAYWGYVPMVRLLLAASADPNARDVHGQRPLHYAVMYSREEAVATLLEGGADREAMNNWGRTALDIARTRGYKNLFEMLTKH